MGGASKWVQNKLGGSLYGPRDRLLTWAEENLIRTVFQNATLPRMSQIFIRDGLSPTGTPITIRDGDDYSIMVGPYLFDNDVADKDPSTLAHEMTHVWQWYHGTLSKAHALTAHTHAGIRRKLGYYDALYDYDILADTWDDMGFEGQAQLVEDWFSAGMGGEDKDKRYCFVKRVLYDGDAGARKQSIHQLCEKAVIDLPPEPIPQRITSNDDSFVRIPGDVLFDFDKPLPGHFDLKAGADVALRQVATTILKSASATRRLNRVFINGHTDSKGGPAYNQPLSERRAEAVARWFSSHPPGIPRSVITVQGFGQSQPVAPNNKPDGSDDPVGRAKNRRVDIYIRNQ
jgi:outer membrane protein OmpA-like peptidoglycan-associated protein